MIFVGDIAHPFQTTPDWGRMAFPWSDASIIANLEGIILKEEPSIHLQDRRLFNHYSIFPALAQSKVSAVTLANNHIMDLPVAFGDTRDMLDSFCIATVGAGANLTEASAPARLTIGGQAVLLLAFGWETIQCQAATRNNPGINPLSPQRVLDTVAYWHHCGLVLSERYGIRRFFGL